MTKTAIDGWSQSHAHTATVPRLFYLEHSLNHIVWVQLLQGQTKLQTKAIFL